MNNNQLLGKLGEDNAVKYLKKNGYKIIQRNYRCKFGEIDIIAQKKHVLVFIEVKTRQTINFGHPIEAITTTKQKHIYKTATHFLLNNKITYKDVRFDAIEVYIKNINIHINHIADIIIDEIK